MTKRDQVLNTLKEESLGSVFINTSNEEQFQNVTLRPILKFQNELLIQFFITYAIKNKKVFFNLTSEEKYLYIENAIKNDNAFRNHSIGLIVGLLNINEYQEYAKKPSSYNKRILAMLSERWKSQLQLLENNN